MPDKHVDLIDPVYDYVLAQRSDANDPVLAALYADTFALGEVAAWPSRPFRPACSHSSPA